MPTAKFRYPNERMSSRVPMICASPPAAESKRNRAFGGAGAALVATLQRATNAAAKGAP